MTGWTALTYAVIQGLDAVVEQLIAAGKADVNAKGNGGRTLLSYVAGEGHEAVVKLLLAVPGIEINAPGPEN